MNRILLALVSLGLVGAVCYGADKKDERNVYWYMKQYPYFTAGDPLYTYETELVWPEGYKRPDPKKLTPFQNWVSNMPLWDAGKAVYSASIGTAFKREQITRPVRFPWRTGLFREYVIPMQLLADYKFWTNRPNDLAFVTKRGDTIRYRTFLESEIAYSPHLRIIYKPSEKRDPSVEEFNKFFDLYAFNANYASIENHCTPIGDSDLRPGDIYVGRDSAGVVGKVYLILVVIANDAGDKRYIVGTGCGEPCDLYIPLFHDDRKNPWITIDELRSLITGHPHIGFLRPLVPGKK